MFICVVVGCLAPERVAREGSVTADNRRSHETGDLQHNDVTIMMKSKSIFHVHQLSLNMNRMSSSVP